MEALFGWLVRTKDFPGFSSIIKVHPSALGYFNLAPEKTSDLWYIIYHLWYIYHISMTYIHDIYHISIYDTVFLDPRCQWSVGMGISGFPIQKQHQNGWFTIPAIHPFTIPAIAFPWCRFQEHVKVVHPGAGRGSGEARTFHQQLLDDRWIGIE